MQPPPNGELNTVCTLKLTVPGLPRWKPSRDLVTAWQEWCLTVLHDFVYSHQTFPVYTTLLLHPSTKVSLGKTMGLRIYRGVVYMWGDSLHWIEHLWYPQIGCKCIPITQLKVSLESICLISNIGSTEVSSTEVSFILHLTWTEFFYRLNTAFTFYFILANFKPQRKCILWLHV